MVFKRSPLRRYMTNVRDKISVISDEFNIISIKKCQDRYVEMSKE